MMKLTVVFRNFAKKPKTASLTCFTLDLLTFGISWNIEWQLRTGVSVQLIVSIRKVQAFQDGLFDL
jgi:hypothetical protein